MNCFRTVSRTIRRGIITAFTLLMLAMAVSVVAMPPTPELRERLQREGRLGEVAALQADARARGFNAPFDFDLNRLRRDDGEQVELRVICLLADFDDNEAERDPEDIAAMLFSVDEYETGSMRDWYLENSYGEVDITGEVYGWYRMPEDYSYYVDSAWGLSEYPHNAQRITEEVIRAADGDVDFSLYDNDGDGRVEGLFVVHAGPGAEVTDNVNDIWSHASGVPRNLRVDGVGFTRYAMEPEDGKIGVFGHELGHSLFGLPDLYDVNYESAGIGMWSMMAAGSWGGGGTRPVHFDAWCKVQAGFLEPFPVEHNMDELHLNPVEEDDDVLLAWKHGEWRNEYFLLENRQQIGFDRSVPGHGLLIWHIDEAMSDNAHPWWPEHGGMQHNIVALEQADGDFDLEQNNNSGDRGDPFPGALWNENFTAETRPSSRDYGRRDTDVAVIHIDEDFDEQTVSFAAGVFPGLGVEEMRLFILNRIPEGRTYPDPDYRDEDIPTDEMTLVDGILTDIGITPDSIATELPESLDDYNVLMYFESWREEEEPSGGLSTAEQERLMEFLDQGNNLLLVGPDVATNLQQDTLLWNYLQADYIDGGVPEDSVDFVQMRANPETRIAGQTFFLREGPCLRYIDEVTAAEDGEGAYLFSDNRNNERGIIIRNRESGYRVVLQPFLFGALMELGGGSRTRLMELYFLHFQYYFTGVAAESPAGPPAAHRLLAAYPNPFNNEVRFALTAENRSGGRLVVYDAVGRRVGELELQPGMSNVNWSPGRLGAGSYFVSLQGVEGSGMLRVVYLK